MPKMEKTRLFTVVYYCPFCLQPSVLMVHPDGIKKGVTCPKEDCKKSVMLPNTVRDAIQILYEDRIPVPQRKEGPPLVESGVIDWDAEANAPVKHNTLHLCKNCGNSEGRHLQKQYKTSSVSDGQKCYQETIAIPYYLCNECLAVREKVVGFYDVNVKLVASGKMEPLVAAHSFLDTCNRLKWKIVQEVDDIANELARRTNRQW